jgi:hypothetical protein
MAITRTNFTGTSLAQQFAQLYEWLSENGTDVFNSVASSSSTITCKSLGDRGSLSINKDINNVQIATPKTSSSSKQIAIPFINRYFDYAIKTGKGIYLNWIDNAESPQYPSGIFVSRSNQNSSYIVWHTIGFNQTSQAWLGYVRGSDMDLNTSDWQEVAKAIPVETLFPLISTQATYTSLTPYVSKSTDSYCPFISILHFNQFVGQSGIFKLNGKSYYSNGYFALED